MKWAKETWFDCRNLPTSVLEWCPCTSHLVCNEIVTRLAFPKRKRILNAHYRHIHNVPLRTLSPEGLHTEGKQATTAGTHHSTERPGDPSEASEVRFKHRKKSIRNALQVWMKPRSVFPASCRHQLRNVLDFTIIW